MKKLLAIAGILAIAGLFALALTGPGCTQAELGDFATKHPSLASTTQKVEQAEAKIDVAADKAKVVVDTGKNVADGAAAIGVPYAATLGTILAVAGAALGKWHERRNGTDPAMTAVAQIVQSVETAFPNKTEQQKTALAAVQDQSTKQLVTQIKGA